MELWGPLKMAVQIGNCFFLNQPYKWSSFELLITGFWGPSRIAARQNPQLSKKGNQSDES